MNATDNISTENAENMVLGNEENLDNLDPANEDGDNLDPANEDGENMDPANEDGENMDMIPTSENMDMGNEEDLTPESDDETANPTPAPPMDPNMELVEETCAKCEGTGKVTKKKRIKVEHPELPCLCGCGELAKPKSSFRPGHDARVKGYIARALKWEVGEPVKAGERILMPAVLVERVREDPAFKVAGYNAETILRLAEVVGIL